jgi:hypothetical protein
MEIEAMEASAKFMAPAPGGQPVEVGTTETYSRSIVGPVAFKLQNLRIAGRSTKPAAPSNSPFIIAANEVYDISVDVIFNQTPLTELLMCLGTQMCICFSFEGFGKKAAEVDLSKCELTRKDVYSYTITYTGVPLNDGLTPGLYAIGAVAEIGPVKNACSTKVFGHGYVKEVCLEVYPAGADL